jgi:hypothetical protein
MRRLPADRTIARVASRFAGLTAVALLSFPVLVIAQSAEPNPESVLTLVPQRQAISPHERREWLVDGILAPKSLGTGLMIGTWQTAVDSPEEWQGPSGFTKRVLTYEADNGISKGIEVGLGRLWGEDPRPTRSGHDGFGGRVGFAMKTVVLAPRSDGHLAPAWGRYAGTVGSNVVKYAWLPSRLTTSKETARRVAAGLLGRLAMNLWEEFGPDLRRRFTRRAAGPSNASRKPAPSAPPGDPVEVRPPSGTSSQF